MHTWIGVDKTRGGKSRHEAKLEGEGEREKELDSRLMMFGLDIRETRLFVFHT